MLEQTYAKFKIINNSLTKPTLELETKDENSLSILYVSDLHFKPTNPTNRHGYIQEQAEVFDNIIVTCELHNIDIIIYGGDIYDRQFNGKNTDAINMPLLSRFQHLKSKGILQLALLGNHDLHALQRYNSSNFFHIVTNYSNSIRHSLKVSGITPFKYTLDLLQAYDHLIINDTFKLHFHHFSDFNKEYLTPKSETENHIVNLGYYHDAILPSQARQFIKTISNSDLGKYTKVAYSDNMFENIDYATCGDIHARIGEMKVNTPSNVSIVNITGSMLRTASGIAQSHESLELPIMLIPNQQNCNILKTNKDLLDSYKENLDYRKLITFKLRPYEKSFKREIIEDNQQSGLSLKKLEEEFQKVTVHKNLISDIITFPPDVQSIVNEVLNTGKYALKIQKELENLK